jgi:hypothetical protein
MKFLYEHTMTLEHDFIYESCMKISYMPIHTPFIYEIVFQCHCMFIQKFHTFFLYLSYKNLVHYLHVFFMQNNYFILL